MIAEFELLNELASDKAKELDEFIKEHDKDIECIVAECYISYDELIEGVYRIKDILSVLTDTKTESDFRSILVLGAELDEGIETKILIKLYDHKPEIQIGLT